jgi:hypothetical protein
VPYYPFRRYLTEIRRLQAKRLDLLFKTEQSEMFRLQLVSGGNGLYFAGSWFDPVKTRSESQAISADQTICSTNRSPLHTTVLAIEDRRAETRQVQGQKSPVVCTLCAGRLLQKLTVP